LDGDVRRRDEVNLLEEDEEQGGQARRIMRSYERQFGDSPELAVLHLIGLFDRPAKRELIDVLRGSPPTVGLNDKLLKRNDAQWKRTLARLKHAKLLSEETADELDAHPLVREHFGARLKAQRPEAWRAGHGRLYEHLRDSAKPLPDTLAEMAPRFQAVYHGCQAGRYQEAMDDVYYNRIQRDGSTNYCTARLGAVGADLAAVSSFFDPPWDRVVEPLREGAKAFLLNAAGFRLRALGRLREAVGPMQAGLERRFVQESWHNAGIAARNLSQLHLTLGDIPAAVEMGATSLDYAERSEDAFERIVARALLANALHQSGEVARAQELFEDAEALQARWHPEYPWLYSVQGYQYCDLLLDLDRAAEVRERAAQTLGWALVDPNSPVLTIALDHLSLGLAALALGDEADTRTQLDQAVDGLRRAGTIHHLPRGLLARAALFRDTGDFELARRGLEEAMRIAKRSEMRLFQCDAHLEYARVALAEGDKEKAREHVAAARRLVEETGYGRRRPEVEALEAEVR
jgi:tetratricopeptide (TPR) repeat protein